MNRELRRAGARFHRPHYTRWYLRHSTHSYRCIRHILEATARKSNARLAPVQRSADHLSASDSLRDLV